MRIALIITFLSAIHMSYATNYYFSNTGSNSNNGTSPATPYQTLSKLEDFGPSAGDSILFKRGDTFYGSIYPNRNGTMADRIVYGAYGVGERPIISGFTDVPSWTNLGSNIWESSGAVSSLSTLNMVLINDMNTPMGRYPNTGYLTFQSHVGKTSITSSSLSGVPNWVGSEVVIRTEQFKLDRRQITGQSSGTITYSGGDSNPTDNWGFFIQNNAKALDQQNEWYYNPITKKIRIYSTFEPLNVKVSSVDVLVTLERSYITFDNITFSGANSYFMHSSGGSITNNTVKNCTINYTGISAFRVSNLSYLKIENDSILNSNNNGIDMWVNNPYALIKNNVIMNTGIYPGMGQSGMQSYEGIAPGFLNTCKGIVIENNRVLNTGYTAIDFGGDSAVIKNNFIDTFCTVLEDGAGIYTNGEGGTYIDRVVVGNIVLNGISADDGTSGLNETNTHGIYIDGHSSNVKVYDNTVANCKDAGLTINEAKDIEVYNNTLYNNGIQLNLTYGGTHYPITGCSILNNNFVSKLSNQLAARFISTSNDLSEIGIIDSNYYARPIDDNIVFSVSSNSYGSFTNYNLAGWQPFSGYDLHSQKSPKTISDVNDLRFEYNATNSPKTVSLGAKYIDVENTSYNGSITLAPFSSAVLIYDSPLVVGGEKFLKTPSGKFLKTPSGKFIRVIQ